MGHTIIIYWHTSRNPRMASGSGYTDYRNNVLYNWGYNTCYGGEAQQKGNPKFHFSTFNIVSNYYKPGPATKPGEVSYRIVNPSSRSETDFGTWYVSDNVVEGNEKVSTDNWKGGVQTEISLDKIKLDKPWESMPINEQPAKEAYELVLEQVGARLPKLDAIDTRIIEEVRGGFATYEGKNYKKENDIVDHSKTCGIIDSQADVGGWPKMKSTAPPSDIDHDGMPDFWEEARGLNKSNAEDRNTLSSDGYTMLETYLNGIK